jgi:hypothetical protein
MAIVSKYVNAIVSMKNLLLQQGYSCIAVCKSSCKSWNSRLLLQAQVLCFRDDISREKPQLIYMLGAS